ncbi:MAG: hypothetical protein RI556_08630 [Hydrogenovibrio sp.]|uniref:hypothetical protein n=1 Tax=Hydrogenovibrio sp. TaxID=2065821 RepID=UPI00286FAF4F|nr:hypothetical protein [Hydrogenovibrio sp.]MDR9498544.1 hypothetical protein [Hydrogenovibrio sp.]MDR9499226.1 hypothetical protein [Hydrogenovibrio sp.]
MQALREFVKVKNRSVQFQLPEGFDYEEVEVIVMPKASSEAAEELLETLQEGAHSPVSEKSHEEVFAELKARYVD